MGIEYSEGSFSGLDGTALFLRRWVPDAPSAAVGIIHGSFEHGGRYAPVAEFLASRGYAVYAMDLRGHGKSAGPRGGVAEFDVLAMDIGVFVNHCQVTLPGKPLFLLAHSAGAAFALHFLLEQKPSDIRGIILSAPAISVGKGIPGWMRMLYPFLEKISPHGRLPGLDPRLISRDRSVVDEYRRDPLVNKSGIPIGAFGVFMRSVTVLRRRFGEVETPFLILQGTDDCLADVEASKRLHGEARSADKTIRLYEHFYHEVLNEPDKMRVFEDIAAWLDARRSREHV